MIASPKKGLERGPKRGEGADYDKTRGDPGS